MSADGGDEAGHSAAQASERATAFSGPGPRCGLGGCARACRVGPGHFDGWATAQLKFKPFSFSNFSSDKWLKENWKREFFCE